jgi:hypothetical protein
VVDRDPGSPAGAAYLDPLRSSSIFALAFEFMLFALDAPDVRPDEGAAASEAAVTEAAIEVVATEEVALDEQVELDLAAANWNHYGCIQLGSSCLDVFQDPKGNLWVCQACFTTQNPNPGKCRRLTASEIANALWCA